MYYPDDDGPFCARVDGWLEFGTFECSVCPDRLKIVRVKLTTYHQKGRELSTLDHNWHNPPMEFPFDEIKSRLSRQLSDAGIKATVHNTTVPKYLQGVFEITIRTTAREHKLLDEINRVVDETFQEISAAAKR